MPHLMPAKPGPIATVSCHILHNKQAVSIMGVHIIGRVLTHVYVTLHWRYIMVKCTSHAHKFFPPMKLQLIHVSISLHFS